jgi:hypothetical protein
MSLFAGRRAASLFALVLLVAGFGCARTSPYVGTWTSTIMGRSATLTLKEDKTGTIVAPIGVQGSQPLTWAEGENNTVTLTFGGGAAAPAGQKPSGQSVNLTGTLSEDKKSLSVTAGPTTLTFQKQADSK